MDAEEIAKKRAERAARKQQNAQGSGTAPPPPDRFIRMREWVPVRDAPAGKRLRVVS